MKRLSGSACVGLLAGLILQAQSAGAAPSRALTLASGVRVIHTDPFGARVVGQHRTEVEPDTFSYGGVMVSAFQVGRMFNGGATGAGWATLKSGSWTTGMLPGLTKQSNPAGVYDRVTDPSVAYDAADGLWLVSTLVLNNRPGGNEPKGISIVVSRSANGTIWSTPVVVATAGANSDFDKEWIACDNTTTSAYYGNCYIEFDDNGQNDKVFMSTSTDGGATWASAIAPSGSPQGLGGQPVVQPTGTVIVPLSSSLETQVLAFRSTDGGASWSSTTVVSSSSVHTVAGGLRTDPLPSAEIDGAGRVYVVWQDCRFEPNCNANDIVMSTSSDGLVWSTPVRIPIDTVGQKVDHMIPGIGVNPATVGATAQLALTYYYYPNASCSASTCRLNVGIITSTNGGISWSVPTRLAGATTLTSLASTNQGRMVGDYISTSFVGQIAVPVFAAANPRSNNLYHEPMYAVQWAVSGGSRYAERGEPTFAGSSGRSGAPERPRTSR